MDDDVNRELSAYRELLTHQKGGRVPKTVVAHTRLMIDFLEELLKWRANGRKWLLRLKQEEQMKGELNDRQVQPFERTVNHLQR